jgi:putative hemolysin
MDNKIIDLEQVINNSQSGFLKRLPGFVIRLLIKIIRQEEVNIILNKYSKDTGEQFLPKMLAELNLKLNIKGIENLPDNGKCFFVANHPFGIADGLALTYIVSTKYGRIKAIGNDVFMLIPQLRPLIAAVNVFGKNYREYITELEKVYGSEFPVTHFPAGLVSRIRSGRIKDHDWHKSFISRAVKHERDIVPVLFPGRNSCIFYFIYLFRKTFRIKTNLELALLPREFFKKRGKTIDVIIGKPISFNTFDDTKTSWEWAQWTRDQLYKLRRS